VVDSAIVIGIAVVAVGGVKLGYAALANQVRLWMGTRLRQWLNAVAGGMMIAIGVLVMVKP
jgi:threonine/homoserine/homoserine lactone efflux protein